MLKHLIKSTIVASVLLIPSVMANWSTSGKDILDPNGNPFIYRGISLGDSTSMQPSMQLKQDLIATRANALKVPVRGDTTTTTLQNYINICKVNKMVCVLSLVEPYGWGENPYAYGMSSHTYTWTTPSMLQLLSDNEDYVVINIGNGAFGDNMSQTVFRDVTHSMISTLRVWGVRNQLMIEGGNWGQDWQHHMLDNAEFLLSKDPLRNMIFGVHIYDAYPTAAEAERYIQAYHDLNLPIVISEFGPIHRKRFPDLRNQEPIKAVDVEGIMKMAQEKGIGYIGWSWSHNPVGYTELDLFDSARSAFTPWAEALIFSDNGIRATAVPATIYSGEIDDNILPAAEIRFSQQTLSCGIGNGILSAYYSADLNGDSLLYQWEITNDVDDQKIIAHTGGTTFEMRPDVNYTILLTVNDRKGGVDTDRLTKRLWTGSCRTSSSSALPSPASSSSAISSERSSSPSTLSSTSSSVISTAPVVSSRHSSSVSSISSSVISSSAASRSQTKATCSYVIQSEWQTGFTAVLRLKNNTTSVIEGWNVAVAYNDGAAITNLWNANLQGSGPYSMSNLSWNKTIQPGQTVEFGFQGSKPSNANAAAIISGASCQ
jgi:mannan endo-1,4-beta-mannosidase